MPEFKILNNIVDYMESTGSTYKLVTLAIDEKLVSEINIKNNTNYAIYELEKAADKCLAHEWLIRPYHGGRKYGSLQITPKGIGAARSRQRSEELKASRSWLKKSSDCVEEHKGILIFIGAVITLATFILKVTGE